MSGRTPTSITCLFGRVGRPRLRLIHRKTQSSNIHRARAFIRGRSVASRWGFQMRPTLCSWEVEAVVAHGGGTCGGSRSGLWALVRDALRPGTSHPARPTPLLTGSSWREFPCLLKAGMEKINSLKSRAGCENPAQTFSFATSPAFALKNGLGATPPLKSPMRAKQIPAPHNTHAQQQKTKTQQAGQIGSANRHENRGIPAMSEGASLRDGKRTGLTGRARSGLSSLRGQRASQYFTKVQIN